MDRIETLTSSGTALALAGKIVGVIPDVLACVALVVGIILSTWLIRKARADTKLALQNATLKELEIGILREQVRPVSERTREED